MVVLDVFLSAVKVYHISNSPLSLCLSVCSLVCSSTVILPTLRFYYGGAKRIFVSCQGCSYFLIHDSLFLCLSVCLFVCLFINGITNYDKVLS